jgi:hypothetical protein
MSFNPIPLTELRVPDLSSIATAFPNFYQVNWENIWKAGYYSLFDPANPFNLSDRAVLLDGVNRPQLLPSTKTGNVIQKQNRKEVNSKGQTTMEARVLSPEAWKIEQFYNEEEHFKGWVMSMRLQKDQLVPSVDNMIELIHNLVISETFKRGGADIRQVIYQGVKASGTSHLALLDGFNKIMKDAATAGDHTPAAITVTSASDVFIKCRQLVSQLGQAYKRDQNCIVKVASDVYDYIREKQDGGGTAPNIYITSGNREEISKDLASTPLPSFPNVKVIEEPYLKSGGMVASVKDNFVVGFDSFNPASQMDMQKHYQELYMVATGAVGVQVRNFKAEFGEKPFVCNELAVA